MLSATSSLLFKFTRRSFGLARLCATRSVPFSPPLLPRTFVRRYATEKTQEKGEAVQQVKQKNSGSSTKASSKVVDHFSNIKLK